jgi:hypothetical protein
MRIVPLIPLFLISSCLSSLAQPLKLKWVAEHPCLAPMALEYDRLLTDDEQNVFLCGVAKSDISPIYSSAILTLKFDSTGVLLWQSKFDNMFNDDFVDCAFKWG